MNKSKKTKTMRAAAKSVAFADVADYQRGVAIPDWGNWAFTGIVVTVVLALIALGVSWGKIGQRLDYQDGAIQALQQEVGGLKVEIGELQVKVEIMNKTLQAIADHLGVHVLP